MNKHLLKYSQSFDPNKKHWLSLGVDAAFFLLLFLSFTFFINYVQDSMYGLNSITHPDYIQQKLSEMNPAEAQAFVLEMRSFLYVFVGGTIFLGVMTIFLFSLSQAILWNKLVKGTFSWKIFPKWVGLSFFLILLILLYLLIALLARLIFTYLLTRITTNEVALSLLNNSLSVGMLILFTLFMFLTFYHLAKDNMVFSSIGKAFKMMDKKFWLLFLLAWITAHIPMLIAIPFDNVLRFNQPLLNVLEIVITLVYLTWLRIYLLTSIEHQH